MTRLLLGIDAARDPGEPRRLEDVERAEDVDRAQSVEPGLVSQTAEVQYPVRARDRLVHGGGIAQVRHDRLLAVVLRRHGDEVDEPEPPDLLSERRAHAGRDPAARRR